MRSRTVPYLTFNGNCREAMEFYRSCLGGKLLIQTVGETPLAARMPAGMKNCILHASLQKGPMILMGTDLTSSRLIRGNSMSISLFCESERQIEKLYGSLSKGGVQTSRIESTFYGAKFGGLTDQFGHQWLLHYRQPEIKPNSKR